MSEEIVIERGYYLNGNLHFEEHKKNGELHGPFRLWYENKQLAIESFHENGVKNGKFTAYREDGTLKEELNYFDGVRHGIAREVDKKGNEKVSLNWLGETIATNETEAYKQLAQIFLENLGATVIWNQQKNDTSPD